MSSRYGDPTTMGGRRLFHDGGGWLIGMCMTGRASRLSCRLLRRSRALARTHAVAARLKNEHFSLDGDQYHGWQLNTRGAGKGDPARLGVGRDGAPTTDPVAA